MCGPGSGFSHRSVPSRCERVLEPHQLARVAGPAGLEQREGHPRRELRVRREQRRLAEHRAVREVALAHEVLELAGVADQLLGAGHPATGRLGRDEVGHDRDDPGVVAAAQDALRPRQVVVQEARVRERAAHVREEAQDLVVVERPPRRQRDLEHPEADVVGVLEALDDLDRRQADDADHRADRLPVDLLVEDVDDLAEAAGVDGVALAAGPEHVAVLEAGREDERGPPRAGAPR